MRHFEIYLFLSLQKTLCLYRLFQKVIQMLFQIFLFIFRQKKLEKVMEEEGLKDEEVINIGKFFLETQRGESCAARC